MVIYPTSWVNLENLTDQIQEKKLFKRIRTVGQMLVIPWTLHKKYIGDSSSDDRLIQELMKKRTKKNFCQIIYSTIYVTH